MRDNSSLREIFLTLFNSSSILHQFSMAKPLPASAAAAIEEVVREDTTPLGPMPSKFPFILGH